MHDRTYLGFLDNVFISGFASCADGESSQKRSQVIFLIAVFPSHLGSHFGEDVTRERTQVVRDIRWLLLLE